MGARLDEGKVAVIDLIAQCSAMLDSFWGGLLMLIVGSRHNSLPAGGP